MDELEATAKQFANRGAAGDLRAAKLAFDIAQKAEEREAAGGASPEQLTASDQEIVGRLIARLRLIAKETCDDPDHA